MTNKLKKLKAELASKLNEFEKVSAAYNGNVNSKTQSLEAELARLFMARAEVRADAALGLPSDEAVINKEIEAVEESLATSKRNDFETEAIDKVLQGRASVIRNEFDAIQADILAERRIIMASEFEAAKSLVNSAARALMEALMSYEKTIMVSNDGGLLKEAQPLYRLPEMFQLPLMQDQIVVDYSRRGEIHNSVRARLDEVLMN